MTTVPDKQRLMIKLTDAVEADCHQPYLEDNDVGAHDLSVDEDGDLLAALIDVAASFRDNVYIPRLQNLLTISPDGEQRLESGANFYGGAVMIGHKRFRQITKNRLARHEIFISIDYATGAMLHEETDSPVAVAVRIGNVTKVYAALREIFPQALIVACLNVEAGQDRMRKKIAAEMALTGGLVLAPRLSIKERQNGLVSFNDQAIFHDSRSAVLEKITDLIQYARESEASAVRGGKFPQKRSAPRPKKKSAKRKASPSRKPSACPKEVNV